MCARDTHGKYHRSVQWRYGNWVEIQRGVEKKARKQRYAARLPLGRSYTALDAISRSSADEGGYVQLRLDRPDKLFCLPCSVVFTGQ